MEVEHYIDGQHNEGVYNSFNLNTYGYCYQSPVILIDPNGKQVWTRILGGVKAVGGALEMVAGGALLITPEPTMATKAAGVVVAVHGADEASSGLKQVWTGEEESSLTSQGLQAAGMSKQNAEIVDASISIVGTMGAGTISNASKTSAVSKSLSGTSTSANRLNHIFGKEEHALDGIVKQYGSQEKAYHAVQKAANEALKSGKLTPNAKGVLPTGDSGNIIQVGKTNVRLIGGLVKDGKVVLSSFSRKGLK